jgi:hypothetical protein
MPQKLETIDASILVRPLQELPVTTIANKKQSQQAVREEQNIDNSGQQWHRVQRCHARHAA